MPESFSVSDLCEAQQAWQEIVNLGKRPYPLGNGTGSAEPLPSPAIRLNGELALIHEINTADRQMTAGCGTTIATLESKLTAVGLSFPARVFDPAKITLGGWMGAGMPGVGGRITPVRRLLGATVLTPQGRLIHSGAATPKDVAGYDFHRPIIGAFGRLGMLLEVIVAVEPQPENVQFTRLIPKHSATFFPRLDQCKTVARLWVERSSNADTKILLEQHGNVKAMQTDLEMLKADTKDCAALPQEPTWFWNSALSEAFMQQGYYVRWSLPTAQACNELSNGDWWGNPWEGRIWRYLGTNQPSGELPAGQIVFKGMGKKLFPCSDIKLMDSNSYIANV